MPRRAGSLREVHCIICGDPFRWEREDSTRGRPGTVDHCYTCQKRYAYYHGKNKEQRNETAKRCGAVIRVLYVLKNGTLDKAAKILRKLDAR
jgi:NAD-dependent SIR2 family protein deacetylase